MKILIDDAEVFAASGNMEKAAETYVKIKAIYETITPEKKREIYTESIRIIKLYNNIVKAVSGG